MTNDERKAKALAAANDRVMYMVRARVNWGRRQAEKRRAFVEDCKMCQRPAGDYVSKADANGDMQPVCRICHNWLEKRK